MNRNWLRGKTVVLVGVASEIGKYLAFNLIVNYNCTILGIDADKKALDDLKNKFEDYSPKFVPVSFNPAQEKNWVKFANELLENKTEIDVLVNAYVNLPKFDRFDRLSHRALTKVLNENFYTSVFSIRSLLPIIHNSRDAAVVNLSYTLSEFGKKGSSAFSASSSALKSFTEVLSDELEQSVYVSLVKVGKSQSGIYSNQDKSIQESLSKKSMTADRVAVKIIDGLCKKKKVIIVGTNAKMLECAFRIFPNTSKKISNKFLSIKDLELYKNDK